jgi:hypothetical protein
MTMDALTEMHLLLREHGWEPEPDTEFEDMWDWDRPEDGPAGEIISTWREDDGEAKWASMSLPVWQPDGDVAALEKRLKALSHSVTKSADAS